MFRTGAILFLVVLILALAFSNLYYFYPEKLKFTSKEETPKSVYGDEIYEPIFYKNSIGAGVDREIYVMPYVGDIDGDVSEDWYFFFNVLTTFHEEEKIPVAFSFYPTSINTEPGYMNPFLRMYESYYIELMQKEYIEEKLESEIENLPSSLKIKMRQGILESEKKHFERIMKNEGYDDIKFPISYTQLGGRITEDDREALELTGINIYFDVYYDDKIGPIKSTEDFDVIQYGVGFTRDGSAGALTTFRSADEIIAQLSSFERLDVEISSVNGKMIIPLWLHQQDFESTSENGKVDLEKWQVYTETLLRLKNDPNVKFITPSEMYNLRHGGKAGKLSL